MSQKNSRTLVVRETEVLYPTQMAKMNFRRKSWISQMTLLVIFNVLSQYMRDPRPFYTYVHAYMYP